MQSGCSEYLLGYDNVDWFVDEVIELEKKITFFFKNTRKHNRKTDNDEEGFKNFDVCRVCEKSIICTKVTDHCHLTGKHKKVQHITKLKLTFYRKKVFHIFSRHDCHLFFKNLIDKKKWIMFLKHLSNKNITTKCLHLI